MRRQSYQNGCVYEDTRKERRGFWYLKWRDADGIQRTTALGKQKLMRHSDVRMTMKYGTVFDEELRRESERIQRNVLQNCSAKPLSY